MTNDPHVRELTALKVIAETLNESNDLAGMLNTVLEKLLDVTGLAAGWIFLVDESGGYEVVADRGLPPALSIADKRPMRCGTCWCLDRYGDGRLRNAVNILHCRRLEHAIAARTGDTRGFEQHATVPLRIGQKRFGILNVMSPGKSHFTDEELALLQAVAFQIGVAVERVRLHEAEQKRAELYAKVGSFSRSLSKAVGKGMIREELMQHAGKLIAECFGWPVLALLSREDDRYVLRALRGPAGVTFPHLAIPEERASWLEECDSASGCRKLAAEKADGMLRTRSLEDFFPPLRSVLAAPIFSCGDRIGGALLIGSDKPGALGSVDAEVLDAIVDHVSVALENARFEERRRELARLEERNRLARDLHDSVSQLLFSIRMTAQGAEAHLAGDAGDGREAARGAMHDVQALAKEALGEMRSLIRQLRPAGLEGGLVSALQHHGERLGLGVSVSVSGILELSRTAEESLWRIGQEAMNNASKHAGVTEIGLELEARTEEVRMSIADAGQGIEKADSGGETGSYGLMIMQERAEAIGGRLRVRSAPGEGTVVEVTVPIPAANQGGATSE
ncbi:GAF domain-containing sensor histidine kinase [Cohnella zeiphila]|uniref:Oxygen sensor histidine kinase NreB n=1 Tax=Cohnella zeiphila TaxID=2761120 RepID=A0A7X0SRL8_9BACL|nr:GAF domain-containing sensor histidine kinase [Cohnella zeiphila]MBB6733665.1 GAF domain-containing sensor histidine kinase [Cohnella zeiphila]